MKKLCMTLALAAMLALPASAARVRFGVSIGSPVYYGSYPTITRTDTLMGTSIMATDTTTGTTADTTIGNGWLEGRFQ